MEVGISGDRFAPSSSRAPARPVGMARRSTSGRQSSGKQNSADCPPPPHPFRRPRAALGPPLPPPGSREADRNDRPMCPPFGEAGLVRISRVSWQYGEGSGNGHAPGAAVTPTSGDLRPGATARDGSAGRSGVRGRCKRIVGWWAGAESNCRHRDFQSFRPATELPMNTVILTSYALKDRHNLEQLRAVLNQFMQTIFKQMPETIKYVE